MPVVSHSPVEKSVVWESRRLSRPDGEYVVRVVGIGTPLSGPEPEVAASGGLAGLGAVVVSSLLRTVGRALARDRFSVRLVRLVPADSRSSDERTVSAAEVRGEREALARARQLVDNQT